LISTLPAVAQKTDADKEKARLKKEKEKEKKELKFWKNKKKSLDPLTFKMWSETVPVMGGEIEGMKRQLSSISENLSDKDKQNATLQAELQELQSNPKKGGSKSEEGSKGNSGSGNSEGGSYSKGLIFKVQIRYAGDDNPVTNANSNNFGVEQVDGKYKYTLGYFRDYWEANNFKKYLRSMGLNDAWIVAYKDNERQKIEDVLSPADIEKKRQLAEKGED
jgi:hypothetical protein